MAGFGEKGINDRDIACTFNLHTKTSAMHYLAPRLRPK